MNDLGHWILLNTAWLYTKVYEGPVFFLDLWSFAHMWSGFFVMSVLLALNVRRPWWVLVACLLAYELLELAFIYQAFHAFRPETLKDQVTDLVVGALGAALAKHLRGKASLGPASESTRAAHRIAALLVPITIAFLWVGNYGYRYDREMLNSPGLNAWAFCLWTLALLMVAHGYASFEARWESAWKALLATSVLYLVGLFAIEYLGSVTLGIHEVGHATRKALVFDLVHGTPTMHTFYLTAPFTTVAALLSGRALLARAFAGHAAGEASSLNPMNEALLEDV